MDKKDVIQSVKTTTSLQTNLTTLEDMAFKVMATDEVKKLAYEDATHLLGSFLVLLLDRVINHKQNWPNFGR